MENFFEENSKGVDSIQTFQEARDLWSARRLKRESRDSAVQQLIGMLTDESVEVRSEAARGLATFSAVEAIPHLIRALEEFFGKSVSRHLNATEAVARGCALQCAMLSPAFRVREFDVQDVNAYSIALRWDKVATSGGGDEGMEDAAAGASAADGRPVISMSPTTSRSSAKVWASVSSTA